MRDAVDNAETTCYFRSILATVMTTPTECSESGARFAVRRPPDGLTVYSCAAHLDPVCEAMTWRPTTTLLWEPHVTDLGEASS